MPAPNDNNPSFPAGVSLTPIPGNQYTLSATLVNLLVDARNLYDWPQGTGAANSQQTVINLINTVRNYLSPTITPNDAHQITMAVSAWAGNNANSHQSICRATPAHVSHMQKAITCLITPGHECIGIDGLCALPGISLVIASKIFRFCSPQHGAAVDRHASYFFNSLQIVGQGNVTQFVREWSNGRHNTSRLAIYQQANYARNKAEYFSLYLPIINSVAQALNAAPAHYYTCAVTNTLQAWTPADVEMAAYYWWALNGAR